MGMRVQIQVVRKVRHRIILDVGQLTELYLGQLRGFSNLSDIIIRGK